MNLTKTDVKILKEILELKPVTTYPHDLGCSDVPTLAEIRKSSSSNGHCQECPLGILNDDRGNNYRCSNKTIQKKAKELLKEYKLKKLKEILK